MYFPEINFEKILGIQFLYKCIINVFATNVICIFTLRNPLLSDIIVKDMVYRKCHRAYIFKCHLYLQTTSNTKTTISCEGFCVIVLILCTHLSVTTTLTSFLEITASYLTYYIYLCGKLYMNIKDISVCVPV